MEILSACGKLMNTTGYSLSRFARNLILYSLKYGRKKLNYIQYSFLGSVKDVDKCCGMPNKSIQFFTWPARLCEDEKICEILMTPYIFLFSPELLILGLLTSNWVNRQLLLHKLGLGMCHLRIELQLSQTAHQI
jgi:hypothetical protein